MYTFEQLKQDVLQEANNIKQFATDEEKGKLDFEILDGCIVNRCVYGQMTGHCDSDRSLELIELCASRFVRDGCIGYIRADGFSRISENVNGTKVEELKYKRPTRVLTVDTSHFSMIEAYILLPEAKNENLLAYIKGETETLEL